MSIEVVVPFPNETVPRPVASPRPLPTTPALLLVSNGKPFVRDVLEAVGHALQEQEAISRFTVHDKSAMVPLDVEGAATLLDGSEIVISGVGDCGGCTACSTTDALRFVELGVPAFIVATTKFKFLVEATQKAYGIDGLVHLYVDHPIWTRSSEWFEETGRELATAIIGHMESWREKQGLAFAPTGRPSPGTSHPTKSLQSSLADVRASLQSDGFDLNVQCSGGTVYVDVLAVDADCLDCLVPYDVFVGILSDALFEADLANDVAHISVSYPTVGEARP